MADASVVRDWAHLVERLRDYALAVSFLGGMNDLDKALHMAADGIEIYVPGADKPASPAAKPARPALRVVQPEEPV